MIYFYFFKYSPLKKNYTFLKFFGRSLWDKIFLSENDLWCKYDNFKYVSFNLFIK